MDRWESFATEHTIEVPTVNGKSYAVLETWVTGLVDTLDCMDVDCLEITLCDSEGNPTRAVLSLHELFPAPEAYRRELDRVTDQLLDSASQELATMKAEAREASEDYIGRGGRCENGF